MMNLQSEQVNDVVAALVKARRNFKTAVKDGTNPHFKSKYTTLEGAINAVTDALLDQGIVAVQQTDIQDARTVLHTRFLHTSGQWIGSTYPVHPVKADPQGEGSALTYARRYSLMALAGIAPEDDDGNAAAKAVEKDNERDAAIVGDWIAAIQGAGSMDEYEAMKAEMMAAFGNKPPAKVKVAFSAQLGHLNQSKSKAA